MIVVDFNERKLDSVVMMFASVIDLIEGSDIESLVLKIDGSDCFLSLNGEDIAYFVPKRTSYSDDYFFDISDSFECRIGIDAIKFDKLNSDKSLAKTFWSRQVYHLFSLSFSRYVSKKRLITHFESIKYKPDMLNVCFVDKKDKEVAFDNFFKMAFRSSCRNGYLMSNVGFDSRNEFGIALSNGSYQCEVHPNERERHIAKNGISMSNWFLVFCEGLNIPCELEFIELNDRHYHNIAHCFKLTINVDDILHNYNAEMAENLRLKYCDR